MDLTDGNTMSVKGEPHAISLTVDLKQLTAHQRLLIIVRDGKNRLADHFLQGKLGQNNGIIPFNHRKIGKILSGFANDIEFRLFTGNALMFRLKLTVGRDCNIVVRQLPTI